jgi:alanyl-tRNA synthetase
MSTVRRYNEDVFLDRGSAKILSVVEDGGRRAVVLDSTVFYPEGGGQPGDRGTINGVAVTEVLEGEDGAVLHFVEGPGADALKPGKAELRLEAARRRYFMTHHTAQHLLSATILRLFGAPTLSMHLGEDCCTIDVDSGTLTAEDLAAAEDAAFAVIEEDYPVIVHLCPPENIADFPLRKRPPEDESVIRVIEIDGYDFSPCCGTHLPSTGPIGIIKTIGLEKYKGMTRVSFLAGRRALWDYRTVPLRSGGRFGAAEGAGGGHRPGGPGAGGQERGPGADPAEPPGEPGGLRGGEAHSLLRREGVRPVLRGPYPGRGRQGRSGGPEADRRGDSGGVGG